MRPLITLLTDFGTSDGTVAEIKAVLYSAMDSVVVVDITHDVPTHGTELGRLVLARYWRRFPAGAVHLVAIVSESRAESAIAVECDGRFLVGRDNGVLSPALLSAGMRVIALRMPQSIAAFACARDVLAPAAAVLAGGAAIDTLGASYADPMIRRTPPPTRLSDGVIAGEVLALDRAGNAITNLLAQRGGVAEVAGRSVPIMDDSRDGAFGDPVAIIGTNGLLEIVIRGESAARVLGLERGTPVFLRTTATD